ncbi:MAG: O-sialoglycoprotein endopeptidase [Parcubacteria group bacterium Gr01-1014_29]|nr:MAG: O-sialoglycoprotein endopeptidase [Parcubacteria group bacterium Gr01-1014_29]
MNILAIETSCDETAIAIIQTSSDGRSFRILSNIVLSQIALHAQWGGVVPNLAKREHEKNLVPLFLQSLEEAKLPESRIMNQELWEKKTRNSYFIIHNSILEKNEELQNQFKKHILLLPKPAIDFIAVTQGPGLEPTLWVGVNFARALSALWDVPLIGINHMEGHIVSALLNSKLKVQSAKLQSKNKKFLTPKAYSLKPISYPALALLVSGGHTELVLIKRPLRYEIIGETRDDAAGEAFDKVARILGLGYPGGPHVAALAQRAQTHAERTRKNAESKGQRISALRPRVSARELMLPRPMMHSKDFDFSFSGLKTAVLYLVRDLEKQGIHIKKLRPTIAKEFQDAVVDVLVAKTIRAAKEYKVKSIILGGGVAANTELRKRLSEKVAEYIPASSLRLPDSSVTGDNALMIAAAAIARVKQAKKTSRSTKLITSWKTLKPNSIMRLL